MIKKKCMTAEWIKAISVRNKYKDLNLIEKVIRAMSLLEMLKLSGCPFCFKGGSALMLILGESAHRLSYPKQNVIQSKSSTDSIN